MTLFQVNITLALLTNWTCIVNLDVSNFAYTVSSFPILRLGKGGFGH